jgi:hypothetical protein
MQVTLITLFSGTAVIALMGSCFFGQTRSGEIAGGNADDRKK